MQIPNFTVSTANMDYLYDREQNRLLDLCMGFGTVPFGHNNPIITDAIIQQVGKFHSPGFLNTESKEEALNLLSHFLPSTLETLSAFSTGMECAEAALRISTELSGKTRFLGFSNSMHGKSLLCNALSNRGNTCFNGIVDCIDYIDVHTEATVLCELEQTLSSKAHAALIIEPIQMSSNGLVASPDFYDRVHELCKQYDTYLIFDEVLTGFYRCGQRFFFEGLNFTPDMLLIGKAIGNGIPTSILAVNRTLDLSRLSYRPGSTFSNHPITLASICSSIQLSNTIDLPTRIKVIEETIKNNLDRQKLFGQGAMWCYQTGSPTNAKSLFEKLITHKILVSFFDSYVRLLPSYLIEPEVLAEACNVIQYLDSHDSH